MSGQEIALKRNKGKAYQIMLFIGVIIVAFNLRPAITSVGPLIGTIRDEVGFSNWSVALLTSLPLIAFAIMSPIAPKIANKTSNEFALALGLFLLMIGVSLRLVSIIFFLFLGTLCIGLGIAICNVLLPGVIKEKFPTKIAIMTSLYTTSMSIFATTASGVSVPLSEGLNLGWKFALFIWIVPAIIGFIIWAFISKKSGLSPNRDEGLQFLETKNESGIWKAPLAWKIALFMGLQSSIFYITISWLPEMLIDFGMNKTNAGFMLSLFQFIGIPISFSIPMIAMKFKSQSILVLAVNCLFVVGMIGLILKSNVSLLIISVILIGAATSANFSLALLFLSIRAKSAKHAAELSGMAQSVGYIIASFGPIIIGFIYDISDNWTLPMTLLIFITFVIIYFGMQAGKNKYVFD